MNYEQTRHGYYWLPETFKPNFLSAEIHEDKLNKELINKILTTGELEIKDDGLAKTVTSEHGTIEIREGEVMKILTGYEKDKVDYHRKKIEYHESRSDKRDYRRNKIAYHADKIDYFLSR